ncbi:hypothetical protein [Sagittula stellata]|uniref:Nuclease (SNase-like) protein n=1 Tax=Sagittula stellata (strain ATCC 700073 / DSM 11524 / E-37) TaxID=388399 RepID=A3K0N5_SAGS3|nr:hypothetical protein [Sagittula stellata]EBA09350.1 nuclease (SNase-like) protein [Sagittula stellata E-37]
MLKILMPVVALALPGAVVAGDRAISGPARVLDGARIVVGDTVVQLRGLESVNDNLVCGDGFACGRWAVGELKARYDGRLLSCFGQFMQDGVSFAAFCLEGREDIGAAILRGGLGFASLDAPSDYRDASRGAIRQRVGLRAFGGAVRVPEAGASGPAMKAALGIPADAVLIIL